MRLILLPDNIRNAESFRAFLADMAELGITPVSKEGLRYAVIAARSNPRWLLLPLDNRRAAAAGLEMLHPVTIAAKLAKAAAKKLMRFGPHGMLGCGHLQLSNQPDLTEAFGERALRVACFTGTGGPHRKTALQIMDEHGAILGYAKLSRAAHVRPYIHNEAQVLRQVAGLQLASTDVPKVLSLRDDTALTLLVTDSTKSAIHTSPLRPRREHLRFLEELHAKTGRIGVENILETLAKSKASLETLAGPNWTKRIARTIATLRPFVETIPVCLVHGDFTPWNTFLQDGRLYVFDWEYANSAWPVGFDLAHFLLATTPPDRQPHIMPMLQDALTSTYFCGDEASARRALLLSLVCHATFYLRRLNEACLTLDDWSDGPTRGKMIDSLLESVEAIA